MTVPADGTTVSGRRGPRILRSVDEMVDYRAMVPLRIAAGLLVIAHLRPFLALAAEGRTYRDEFWVPYAGWYPELPEALYGTALWVAVGTAVLVSLGWFTKAATAYTAGFVVYNLFLSQTHYHHNRAFLSVLLVALALVPAGGAVSVDAWRAVRRGVTPTTRGVRWPLMLVRFQVGVVYAASGFSKLIDPDWFGGTVTRLRVVRDTAGADLPDWLGDLLVDPAVHGVAAKVIVLAELFIGIGLLVPRTRLAAVWLAIPFHVIIELTAEVQLFSYAALAALVIWVTPVAHDRVLRVTDGAGRRAVTAVRLLDWTGRFRIERGEGAGWELVDRDGTVLTGVGAGWRLASRVPLGFWFAGPVAAMRRPPP